MPKKSDDKRFSEPFTIYRAKPDGSGSASQWSLASKGYCVFLEMAHQDGKGTDGNASFDWENKIKFKLSETDLGEVLAVLSGIKRGVGPPVVHTHNQVTTKVDGQQKHKGLYHSNEVGNAILHFGEDEYNNLRICLSVKRGENVDRVMHSMSQGEACVLHTLLRRAIEVMYRWH